MGILSLITFYHITSLRIETNSAVRTSNIYLYLSGILYFSTSWSSCKHVSIIVCYLDIYAKPFISSSNIEAEFNTIKLPGLVKKTQGYTCYIFIDCKNTETEWSLLDYQFYWLLRQFAASSYPFIITLWLIYLSYCSSVSASDLYIITLCLVYLSYCSSVPASDLFIITLWLIYLSYCSSVPGSDLFIITLWLVYLSYCSSVPDSDLFIITLWLVYLFYCSSVPGSDLFIIILWLIYLSYCSSVPGSDLFIITLWLISLLL